MEIPLYIYFVNFGRTFYICEDEYYFEISEILHLFHDKQQKKKQI